MTHYQQVLVGAGLSIGTVDNLLALRVAYSMLHSAKHSGDLRQKRAARRALELAKRERTEKDSWN